MRRTHDPTPAEATRWLLLMHQLLPKPAYLRVKVWRLLGTALTAEGPTLSRAEARTKLARLRAEVARVVAIDFFGADRRETVEGLLKGLEAQLQEDNAMAEDQQKQATEQQELDALKGRTSVTRQGVYRVKECMWTASLRRG